MQDILSVAFFGGFAIVLAYGLYGQVKAAWEGTPQLYNRPVWLVLIYDISAALALGGFLTAALTESDTKWHEQLMFFGIGTIGIGGEAEVLVNILRPQQSDFLRNWATRVVTILVGLFLMSIGFGNLSP